MRFLLMLAIGLAVAAPAVALTPGTGVTASSEITDTVFGAIEKKIIKDFFGGGEKKAKENKGKSGKMPPGLARHIERYGTLPPGLAKKPLPPGLAGRRGRTIYPRPSSLLSICLPRRNHCPSAKCNSASAWCRHRCPESSAL